MTKTVAQRQTQSSEDKLRFLADSLALASLKTVRSSPVKPPKALSKVFGVSYSTTEEVAVECKGSPARGCDLLSRKSIRSLIGLRNRINDLLDHKLSREVASKERPSAFKEHQDEDKPNRAARRLEQFTAEARLTVKARLPKNPKKEDILKVYAEAYKDPRLRKYKYWEMPIRGYRYKHTPSEFLPVHKATQECWETEVPQMVDPDGEYTVDYTPLTHVSVKVKLRMAKSFVIHNYQVTSYPFGDSLPPQYNEVPEWPASKAQADRPHRRLRSELDVLEAVSQNYDLFRGYIGPCGPGFRPPDR